MNTLACICIGFALAAAGAAAMAIVFYHQRTKKTLARIANMLDTAINGSFAQGIFDESALSAVEAKLARYLSICTVSSQNLLAEKDKINSLISDISHQTKTPLANILLYAQLLSEHELPEDGKACMQALSAQAEKLNFLISALVKTSRLETGIMTVSPKEEVIQKLLDEVRAQIRPKAEAKGILIDLEDTASWAYFDLKWTTEAVYNIIDNAVKYTPSGGRIHIKVIPYELFCRIDITDNGIGIAEDEQSKIFTRFYRSRAVDNQEGVGLGLFLAREIISAEGGYIKVSSQLGSGSTFSVFLPGVK
ncbi:MAG: HAMP domain-containing histidine kinase [Dehalobacter sp. 4CP]|uniref:sensor histidine kinase n=1 Tax=Dehalobacter sp. CP TaxID=2594474 RepID=UPI0013C75908|nr:HAMP domain-containing histidine kinase [Dehalobacter sp.]NBJ15882.1 HAMP domain-containing histidine kinase [Dehalobacter sp. 4CP]